MTTPTNNLKSSQFLAVQDTEENNTCQFHIELEKEDPLKRISALEKQIADLNEKLKNTEEILFDLKGRVITNEHNLVLYKATINQRLYPLERQKK